jgi:coenzyme F420-reducing hydrogenase beta subunit
LLPLEKLGLSLRNCQRIYYRRGHWRGVSTLLFSDGTEKSFSYTNTICVYKNAYFFENKKCLLCQDHFGATSDISFGDLWLKEMKRNPVKHTSCIIRSNKGLKMYESAVKAGSIIDDHICGTNILLSQKRSLIFKYNCAKAKVEFYKNKGKEIELDTSSKCKWNHKFAFYLAYKNCEYSKRHYDELARIPMKVIFYYMCLIRVLLSF